MPEKKTRTHTHRKRHTENMTQQQPQIDAGGYIGYLIFDENAPNKQQKLEFHVVPKPEQTPKFDPLFRPRHVLQSASTLQRVLYIGIFCTVVSVLLVLVLYYILHALYLPFDANTTETILNFSQKGFY